MDRFIEEKIFEKAERKNNLKSNMDRFIAVFSSIPAMSILI